MRVLLDFDEKGTMRILLALIDEEKNITELREIEGVGLNALYNALEALKQLGLILEREGYYRARIFTLTDKGKRAAEKIIELKKIIEEE
ncbi:MAG: winged helix-turn-helix transcriptional regulator [Candidatus Heimdallarchaeaceae archaeon]